MDSTRSLPRTAAAGFFVILAFLCAPAAAQDLACTAGQTSMLEAELVFGRSIGGRLGVTEARWRKFLAAEVTPRFPNGLTVIDGTGQWREPASRRIAHEQTKILMIVAADEAGTREKIAAVVDAYKKRFRQHAVGVLTRAVCAAF